MSADSTSVDDSIPLELRRLCPPVCVECDYSLVGLPPGARCPECGAISDPGVLTIRGWSPGSIATMRPGRIVLQIVVVVTVLGIYLSTMTGGRRSFALLIYLAAAFLWPVFQLLRYWPSGADVRTPVRLRVSADGFEQRVGPGSLKLTAWDRRMVVDRKSHQGRGNSLTVRWEPTTFVLTTKTQLIMFEFEANPSHAEAVQCQIRHWISQSK